MRSRIHVPGAEDGGFSLLETLVALAISSLIATLLLSALTAIGRSQEKVAAATEFAGKTVFDRALVERISTGISPGYHDEPLRLTGNAREMSGLTNLDASVGTLEPFGLSIQEGADSTQLRLSFRRHDATVLDLGSGKFRFQYLDHYGLAQSQWVTRTAAFIDPILAAQAPYADALPRQIRVIGEDMSRLLDVRLVLDLATFNWPPPRPQDQVTTRQAQM
jgi:prepilin-type N-terminal cleavage/methylation domain-containing protein